MLIRFILSLVVWLVVAVILELVGSLLGGTTGAWLQNNNVLIGFLAGVIYFFFGEGYPIRRI